jgi:hypothetical protein
MYVTAMNRLRAAYVDLDPGVAPYLMAAAHDDRAGADRTYFFFGNRNPRLHVAGSSMTFMIAVNAALLAILSGLLMTLFGAGTVSAVIVGAVIGTAFLTGCSIHGYLTYMELWRRFNRSPPRRQGIKTEGPSVDGGHQLDHPVEEGVHLGLLVAVLAHGGPEDGPAHIVNAEGLVLFQVADQVQAQGVHVFGVVAAGLFLDAGDGTSRRRGGEGGRGATPESFPICRSQASSPRAAMSSSRSRRAKASSRRSSAASTAVAE